MNENGAASQLSVVYVLRAPRYREAFLSLMSELRVVTTRLMSYAGADPGEYTMTEHPDRAGWFIERLRFSSEKERAKFDDLYSCDRKTTALQTLVDDLVDGTRSDYVLTRAA
jgi:hypothetical protein